MFARRALFLISGLTAASLVTTPAEAQRRGGGQEGDSAQAPTLASSAGSLRWRSIGPAVISGRISDLAIHPTKL